jgi:uncharacterized protein CbrC (UPF0167 family)
MTPTSAQLIRTKDKRIAELVEELRTATHACELAGKVARDTIEQLTKLIKATNESERKYRERGDRMEELFNTLAARGITLIQEKHRIEILSWFDDNGKARDE